MILSLVSFFVILVNCLFLKDLSAQPALLKFIFHTVFFSWVALGVFEFLKKFKKFNSYSKIFLTFNICIWATLLLLHHPGYYSYDTFGLQNILNKYELSEWHGIMYSMITEAFFTLNKSLFLFAVFQVYLFIACLVKALEIHEVGSKSSLFFLLLMSFAPLFQMTLLFINRDIFFGILTSYFLLCLAYQYLKSLPMDNEFLIKMLLLCFVLSEIRQDAKVYLLALPIVLLMLNEDKLIRKKIMLSSALLIFMSVSINLLWINRGFRSANQLYQLTGVLHPLHYIVHTRPDKITEEEKSIIGSVVDYSELTGSYHENIILPFHNNKYTLPVSDKKWVEFLKTYQKLVFDNVDLFFSERARIFLTTLNFHAGAFVFNDDFDGEYPFANEVRANLGLERWNFLPKLKEWHTIAISILIERGNDWFTRMSVLSPLTYLLCAFILVFPDARSRKIYLVAMIFIFSRFPIVFFLAPEPNMKYYSPVIYFPLFVILFASQKRLGRI